MVASPVFMVGSWGALILGGYKGLTTTGGLKYALIAYLLWCLCFGRRTFCACDLCFLSFSGGGVENAYSPLASQLLAGSRGFGSGVEFAVPGMRRLLRS